MPSVNDLPQAAALPVFEFHFYYGPNSTPSNSPAPSDRLDSEQTQPAGEEQERTDFIPYGFHQIPQHMMLPSHLLPLLPLLMIPVPIFVDKEEKKPNPDSVIEACIHPVSDELKRDGTDDCTICLDSIDPQCHHGETTEETKEAAMLKCGHAFHKECVRNWLRLSLSCPLCRHSLDR